MRAFIWSKALKAIEARGAILFYLTAYSPDLNPIEQLFAKLKSMLRKLAAYSLKRAAYTVDSLCAAIASSLTEITQSECWPTQDMVNLIGKRSKVRHQPSYCRQSSAACLGNALGFLLPLHFRL
jgi:DDE superfamily endonuclease